MKRLLLLVALVVSSLFAGAQGLGQQANYNPSTGYYGSIWVGINNNVPFRYEWENASSGETNDICSDYSFARLDATHNDGTPTSIVWADANGYIHRSPIGSIPGIMLSPTLNSLASGSKSFNTAYQVSSTKVADIRVSAQVSTNLSLSGGQSGQIFLEYSANGSTGWTFAGEITGSNTGTLTIGLNTTQVSGAQVGCVLPIGYYWRLRTAGTGTFTFLGGLETTY